MKNKSDNSSNSYKNSSYENKNDKAHEYKSSAIALIIIGIIGLIFYCLIFFNVINLHMTLTFKMISCSAMGIFCIFLIVTGIFSFKQVKTILKDAKEEDVITTEIEKWYRRELKPEDIDDVLRSLNNNFDSLNEGDLFFHRCAIIRGRLRNKFMNLDEKYEEFMTENIYQELFENDN